MGNQVLGTQSSGNHHFDGFPDIICIPAACGYVMVEIIMLLVEINLSLETGI